MLPSNRRYADTTKIPRPFRLPRLPTHRPTRRPLHRHGPPDFHLPTPRRVRMIDTCASQNLSPSPQPKATQGLTHARVPHSAPGFRFTTPPVGGGHALYQGVTPTSLTGSCSAPGTLTAPDFPAYTRSEASLRPAGFAPRRRSFRNTTSLWLRLNSMLRLLRHREAAALRLDAPYRDHHRLHAHRSRAGDDEVQLRDAHQTGRNPDEGNRRRHAAYRHRDGQLRLRQYRSRRTARRACASDQKRVGVAVARNVGDCRLALLGSGRGDQRPIRRGEQAGGGGRHHKGVAGP